MSSPQNKNVDIISIDYKSSGFINLNTTAGIHLSGKEAIEKEIESDDFLREFFSISKKIERVPTPKQIKEQYYSR